MDAKSSGVLHAAPHTKAMGVTEILLFTMGIPNSLEISSPVATRSFGAIGVFAIKEMGRFYRHVLIQKNYPHHGAVAFGHHGKALFEVFKYLGVPMEDINYNQPKSLPYPTENPFA